MWILIEQPHERSHEHKADVWRLSKTWLLKIEERERIFRRMPSRRHYFLVDFLLRNSQKFSLKISVTASGIQNYLWHHLYYVTSNMKNSFSIWGKKNHPYHHITSLTNHNLPYHKDNDSASSFTNIEKLIKSSNKISPNFLFKCN